MVTWSLLPFAANASLQSLFIFEAISPGICKITSRYKNGLNIIDRSPKNMAPFGLAACPDPYSPGHGVRCLGH